MLKAAGYEAKTYGSAEAFLENGSPRATSRVSSSTSTCPAPPGSTCSAASPGTERPEGPSSSSRRTIRRVRAARRSELGAVAFSQKPFEGRQLLNAVDEALGGKGGGD